MDHGWGSFRTTDGEVSVGNEAIHVEKTPKKFLRGQRLRWRNGGRRQQLTATSRIVWFLFAPLMLIYQLYVAIGMPLGVAAVLSFGTVALNISHFLMLVRGTSVRFSAIENVALDTDDRKLTITHDAPSRLALLDADSARHWSSSDDGFSAFGTRETKTQLTLPTDDDVHEARTVLRARGVHVHVNDDATEPKTETEYRFERKDGFAFCERCGSRVSPRDGTCPTCEYALRVEHPVETDSRELSTEF